MNAKTIKFSFILLFLFSCSFGRKGEFLKDEDTNQTDLVDVFNLDNKDFEKFKESANIQLKKKLDPPSQKKSKTKIKNKKSKKSKKSRSLSNNNSKNKKVTKIAAVEEVILSGDDYPKDFPNLLKKMDKKSAILWPKFKPRLFVGEKMIIDVKYFGVTAGRLGISTLPSKTIGGIETYHILAKLRSAPFYKYIYELEDFLESYISVDEFLPVKYSLVQRESSQDVDDLQVFDYEKKKTFFWYKRDKKNRPKKNIQKEGFIPKFVQDSFSALFFVRGLPLNTGDSYEFPIVTRAKLWLLKVDVITQESIKIGRKDVWAYKLKAETHFPGVLKKAGDNYFWFSADKYRTLIKFQAKVKLGSIEGELVDYSH